MSLETIQGFFYNVMHLFPYRLTPYTLNKAYYSFHRLPDNKARFPLTILNYILSK